MDSLGRFRIKLGIPKDSIGLKLAVAKQSRCEARMNALPSARGRITVAGLVLASSLVMAACSAAPIGPGDPLPSWNDGPAKNAIVEFVAKITRQGGPEFVPLAERIATVSYTHLTLPTILRV